ncbi:ATP-binding protein [Bdellovibrio sp. HCB337]|uniref:ATP-binding protein n=1 Tax=Bdellovibrio sp. HCB337 TaxID=3394358 RepID=UPI0039A7730B
MKLKTDEQLRLRALYDYKILDTDPEPPYDDITRLASMIFKTPMAAVTLVEENRQWFKSSRGLDYLETPLITSICASVVKDKKTIIVKDATQDSRFKNYEIVENESQVRFYAGAPLITPDGHAIGALCIIDDHARTMSSFEVEALEALSRQVVNQLELRKANINYKDAYEKIHEQQQQLLQSSKLASIGEMATSIAHEINNPLTIINGNVGLLRRLLQQFQGISPKGKQYLDSIENTVSRIDKIIRGMKALSHNGARDPFEAEDLRQVITNAIAFIHLKYHPHKIELRETYQHRQAWAECRSIQIEQIIINLLSNSFDAVSNLKEKWIEIQLTEENLYWKISVIDSGKGIDKSVQDKIMRPFFTTKMVHEGTGLGLSISKGLAEDHRGTLELDPKFPNTKFVLKVPKIQKT